MDLVAIVLGSNLEVELTRSQMGAAISTNNLELIKLLFDLRPEYNYYGILYEMKISDVASLLKRYPELIQRVGLDSTDTKDKLNELILLMPELATPTPVNLKLLILTEKMDLVAIVLGSNLEVKLTRSQMGAAISTNNFELIKLLFDLRPEYNYYGILYEMKISDVASLLKRYPELIQRVGLDATGTKDKLNELFLLMPELENLLISL